MVMPAASEPALCVRERKCALLEVIELQRKLIEQREDSEELEWYAEQTKRLERFKLALNSLRLQPDEFALRVPCEWMPGSRTSTRGMAECKLRVNSRSQMAFVPADATAQPSGDPAVSADASGEPSEDAEACRPRVFFIDELRVIRTEPQPEGDAPTLVLSWRRVEDRSECSLRCVAPEAIEVSEVLGQHLRRYNASRVATAERMARGTPLSAARAPYGHIWRLESATHPLGPPVGAVHALKSTAYDCANEGHEQLLRRLWQCGFPGVELTQRVTADWIRIGFQGPDPATDFRGMGVLGLQNLVYFGEHYPDVFARLVTAQRKRDYPLACAGINVTFMLLELLQLKDAPPDEVQRRPPVAEAWDTDLFRFFCHMFYREYAERPARSLDRSGAPSLPLAQSGPSYRTATHAPPPARSAKAPLRGHVLLLAAHARPHLRLPRRGLRRLPLGARRAAHAHPGGARAAAALLSRVQALRQPRRREPLRHAQLALARRARRHRAARGC